MRKIEQRMLEAIQKRKDWAQDNTCVEFAQHKGNPYCDATVYLHGNMIAAVLPGGQIVPDVDTFRMRPTVTTASRLRALGFDARIKNHRPVLDGEVL